MSGTESPAGRRLLCEGRVGYGAAFPSPMGFSAGCNFPPDPLIPSKQLAQLNAPASQVMVMDGVPSGTGSRPLWDSRGFYMNYVHSPFLGGERQHYALPPNFPNPPLAFHQRPHGRHQGQVTVAYADGHVKATPFEKLYGLPERKCDRDNGTYCSTISDTRTQRPDLWELWE